MDANVDHFQFISTGLIQKHPALAKTSISTGFILWQFPRMFPPIFANLEQQVSWQADLQVCHWFLWWALVCGLNWKLALDYSSGWHQLLQVPRQQAGLLQNYHGIAGGAETCLGMPLDWDSLWTTAFTLRTQNTSKRLFCAAARHKYTGA